MTDTLCKPVDSPNKASNAEIVLLSWRHDNYGINWFVYTIICGRDEILTAIALFFSQFRQTVRSVITENVIYRVKVSSPRRTWV